MAFDQLIEPANRLEFSLTLTQEINAAPSVDEAFAVTLRLFCQAGGWALGQVWLPSTDGSVFLCGPVWHSTAPALAPFRETSMDMRFTPGMPLIGSVWSDGAVRWVENMGADREFRRADVAEALGLTTALMVPVVVEEDVIAILEFFAYDQRGDDAGLRELVASSATQLGSLMAQKRAETELRLSEARFRAVAETASDAIVSIDSHGLIRYVNAEAARMLGRRQDQLLHQPVTVIIPERLRSAHEAGVARYLATRRGHLIGSTVTVPVCRQDGSELLAELSLATWNVDGTTYFSAILRDVSERHRAQQELERALAREREAAERLQELDRLKSTILDVVSHDLRSPLATIRAIASVLQRDASAPNLSEEQRRSFLSGLEASGMKMRRLLDNLLDTERLAVGDATLQRSLTDLAEVAESMVSELGPDLAGREVSLDLDFVQAFVDRIKVERIIENLLVNASRHTPPGTPVSVVIRRDGEAVLICVEDAGPGVPDVMREKVFERLHQGQGASRVGIGMGLSLVARLAQLHGGHAWVETSARGGASFRVRLPITATAMEEVAHGPSGVPAHLR